MQDSDRRDSDGKVAAKNREMGERETKPKRNSRYKKTIGKKNYYMITVSSSSGSVNNSKRSISF